MENQEDIPLFVSVVVIVLNGADTIGACLDSLMDQTYPQKNYEVIVVDNGSTDGTVDIVKKYPVKIVHESVRGYAPARNAGVRTAQGEVVAFTDSDCVAEPDWLAILLQPYADPKIGIVGGEIYGFPSENPTLVEKFIDRAGFVGPPKYTINGVVPYITTANVSYRKQMLESAGMFNPDLPSCEDVDVSRYIQLVLGAKAVLRSEAIVYHRHWDHLTGLLKLMQRNGYGEIIMATRWKNYDIFQTNPKQELKHISKQFFALGIYLGSFGYRSLLWFTGKKQKSDVMYPVLYFFAEGATIAGKLKAFVDTKMLQVTPKKQVS